jgi:hypothetical protein
MALEPIKNSLFLYFTQGSLTSLPGDEHKPSFMDLSWTLRIMPYAKDHFHMIALLSGRTPDAKE